jgi:Trypsin-co-occurring domain 1
MPARMIVELPDGKQILFGGTGAQTGLSEVGVGEDIAKATSEGFKSALGSLGELVRLLEGEVGGMAKRPDKVEIEFGFSLSGEAKLWIVSGKGDADFKAKLSWG